MGPRVLAASVDMYDSSAAGPRTAAATGAALAPTATSHPCIRYSMPVNSSLVVLNLTFASRGTAAAVRSTHVHI